MDEQHLEGYRKRISEQRDRVFMSEAHLEEHFTRKVKEAGGLALKFTSLSRTGLPDRIVFYKGLTWLVELKTPKGTVQSNQKVCHNLFKVYGFDVRIVRNKQQVAAFIEQMKNLEL